MAHALIYSLIYLVFNILQHEKEYQEIIDAVKCSSKEKRLSSKLIEKKINLADQAIVGLLDLCEDENIQIRRQAMSDLLLICNDMKEYTSRISDILVQLLIAEDPLELQQIHMSLQLLLKYDAKGTLAGIVRILNVLWFLLHVSNDIISHSIVHSYFG